MNNRSAVLSIFVAIGCVFMCLDVSLVSKVLGNCAGFDMSAKSAGFYLDGFHSPDSDPSFDELVRQMSKTMTPLSDRDQQYVFRKVKQSIDNAIIVRPQWPASEMVWYQLGDLEWLALTSEPYRIVISPQWPGSITTTIDLFSVNAQPFRSRLPVYVDGAYCAGVLPNTNRFQFVITLQKMKAADKAVTVYETTIERPLKWVSSLTDVVDGKMDAGVNGDLSGTTVNIVDFGDRVGLRLYGKAASIPKELAVGVRADVEVDGISIGHAVFVLGGSPDSSFNQIVLRPRWHRDPFIAVVPLDIYVKYDVFKQMWAKRKSARCVFRGEPQIVLRQSQARTAWIGTVEAAKVEIVSHSEIDADRELKTRP